MKKASNILFLLIFIVFGCQNPKELDWDDLFEGIEGIEGFENFEGVDADIFFADFRYDYEPFVYVPKKKFPKWLVEIVNEFEDMFVGLSPHSLLNAHVNIGKWKGQTIIQTGNRLSSLMYTFYTGNGERLYLEEMDDPENFMVGSTNWVSIYQIIGGEVRTWSGNNGKTKSGIDSYRDKIGVKPGSSPQ